MGHRVPTLIGVERRHRLKKITPLIANYMAMGQHGMLNAMTVRDDVKRGNYTDPGP